MNGYDFAQGFLWTLPAVVTAAFVVVLLILRWVFVPVTRAKLVSETALVARFQH